MFRHEKYSFVVFRCAPTRARFIFVVSNSGWGGYVAMLRNVCRSTFTPIASSLFLFSFLVL